MAWKFAPVNNYSRTPGLRRTIKVYGPLRDPNMEERRRRYDELYGTEPLKPHAALLTTVSTGNNMNPRKRKKEVNYHYGKSRRVPVPRLLPSI